MSRFIGTAGLGAPLERVLRRITGWLRHSRWAESEVVTSG